MRRPRANGVRWPRPLACALLGVLLPAAPAAAHVNPGLVLLSDRDAMPVVLPGAVRFPDRRLKLTSEQKDALHKTWRFKAGEGQYRVYEGRDAASKVVGNVVFLVQATIHSPVRVAVGVGHDGRVTGAAVVELSQESYTWVRPLLEERLLKRYVGLDVHADFTPPADPAPGGTSGAMQAFYAKILSRMVQWAAALCETAGLTSS